jgi:thymidylate synthase (FAD)
MRLIKPSIEFLWMSPNPLKAIERAGRTCYKSENKITAGSAEKFVKRIIKSGHLAVIEHASASYRIICDRGVTHEIVRHRLFSYCQESTRYCNYKGGVTYIIPPWIGLPEDEYHKETGDFVRAGGPVSVRLQEEIWLSHMISAENDYIDLLSKKYDPWTPQQARSVLPNSLKTEIVITGNLREWLHFFNLRCAPSAHPQMREIADLLLTDIRVKIPVIFDSVRQV